jgi:hypothetical protein
MSMPTHLSPTARLEADHTRCGAYGRMRWCCWWAGMYHCPLVYVCVCVCVCLGWPALPGGERAQIGIVKNVFHFRPYSDWNPLERFVAGMLDGAFNASVLGFFEHGVFDCRLGHVRVRHVNPRYATERVSV